VLFAPDLVAFVLGRERWEPATVLLQGLAVAGLVQHIGFNWFSFYRAHEDTRPPAIEAAVGALAFCALALPGLAAWGSAGFVAGRVAGVAVAVCVRWRYVRRMLPGVRLWALVAPAALALGGALAVTGALRLALWGGERTLAQAAVELALFCTTYAAAAVVRERTLLRELGGRVGY